MLGGGDWGKKEADPELPRAPPPSFRGRRVNTRNYEKVSTLPTHLRTLPSVRDHGFQAATITLDPLQMYAPAHLVCGIHFFNDRSPPAFGGSVVKQAEKNSQAHYAPY